jgi:hypothetical protein
LRPDLKRLPYALEISEVQEETDNAATFELNKLSEDFIDNGSIWTCAQHSSDLKMRTQCPLFFCLTEIQIFDTRFKEHLG